MMYAALAGHPIERLLLNDVGPALATEGLSRIATYVGQAPTFATYEEASAYLRELSAGFGPMEAEQWDLLARPYWVQEGGRWRVHYDPRIAEPIRKAAGQPAPDLWPLYDAVRCPTWLVRGQVSDLLSEATAREMARRGPRATLVEVPGVGHAPTFIPADQIAIVERFLAA
jgi:pimeloyl-ACP methyl ester carboxylesterase